MFENHWQTKSTKNVNELLKRKHQIRLLRIIHRTDGNYLVLLRDGSVEDGSGRIYSVEVIFSKNNLIEARCQCSWVTKNAHVIAFGCVHSLVALSKLAEIRGKRLSFTLDGGPAARSQGDTFRLVGNIASYRDDDPAIYVMSRKAA